MKLVFVLFAVLAVVSSRGFDPRVADRLRAGGYPGVAGFDDRAAPAYQGQVPAFERQGPVDAPVADSFGDESAVAEQPEEPAAVEARGAADAYGAKRDINVNCEPYFEDIKLDRCEPYTEKVCTTTQLETCADVEDKNCRAIVASKQDRKCFNVTELRCSLKEKIVYDVIQAVFTVQKCRKVTERVCDTVYESYRKPMDDYQCVTLYNPACQLQDETVQDRTCRTTVNFNCGSGFEEQKGYKSSAYAQPNYGCQRTPETRCYSTPRTVSFNKCDDREEQVCEKLTERLPHPKEKQVCHDEVKKVCELEQRTQPKQVKMYRYTKDCRPVSRQVCDNADVKKLVARCVPASRKQCHFSPVEKCEDIPKQHCYQVLKRVKKERCTPAYPAERKVVEQNIYG